MHINAILSGRLLCDLIDELTCGAEINYALPVLAPPPLGDEETDESFAAAGGQLKAMSECLVWTAR